MLATVADYEHRYGPDADQVALEANLATAGSLVRHSARLHISALVDDVIVADGTGTPALWLPAVPVTAVASVHVAGEEVDPGRYEWWPHGEIRLDRGVWPRRARLATVVCSHGWDPVPPWIVGLVCSSVQRASSPQALERVQSETTGSQSISFAVSAVGATLWLTGDERARLRALRGPQAR